MRNEKSTRSKHGNKQKIIKFDTFKIICYLVSRGTKDRFQSIFSCFSVIYFYLNDISVWTCNSNTSRYTQNLNNFLNHFLIILFFVEINKRHKSSYINYKANVSFNNYTITSYSNFHNLICLHWKQYNIFVSLDID